MVVAGGPLAAPVGLARELGVALVVRVAMEPRPELAVPWAVEVPTERAKAVTVNGPLLCMLARECDHADLEVACQSGG